MSTAKEIAREFITDFMNALLEITEEAEEFDFAKVPNPNDVEHIAEVFAIKSFGSEFIVTMSYWDKHPNVSIITAFTIENHLGQMEYRSTETLYDLAEIFKAIKKNQ